MENIYYAADKQEIPNVQKIGGKALNLAILTKNELPVPKWFVLTTDFFETFMADKISEIDLLLSQSYQNNEEIVKMSEKITDMIKNTEFNPDLKSNIETHLKEIFNDNGKGFFSVRSSAVDEDSKKFSFAGQLESFLYLKADNFMFESIKNCFASAFSERVMVYRFSNNIPFKGVRPAVIIQEMIFGDVSGVMFTGNPLNNDTDQILINSAYGIGEGIVSGELDSDLFVVDISDKIIDKKIANKIEEITFDNEKGFGTIKKNISNDKANQESIDEQEVNQIVNIGRKIESVFKNIPQDIEWCIYNKNIYILQSRPVTTLSHIDKNEIKSILDNSNIIESYPGVTSPFTFSFASLSYATVYRQFYGVMGVSPKKIEDLSYYFRNLLCYINGRVYYNLNCWHATLQLLPGYKINSEFMDNMMGVKRPTKLEADDQITLSKKIFIEGPKLLYGVSRIIGSFSLLKRIIKKFITNFYAVTNKYMDEKFEAYTSREILDIYSSELEPKILKNWKAPIINDLYVMIYFGVLTKMLKNLDIPNNQSVQNDLLCGEGEMESTKPTMEIIRISNWIRGEQKVLELFASKNEEELIDIILNSYNKEYDEISQKIKKYISEYGFRCMGELKLEEPSLKEEPAFLFTMLKNYLKKAPIDLNEMQSNEREIRFKAEKIVFAQLKGHKKKIFMHVLKNAREAIKNREELRFMRTKIFGIVRSMFNAVGKNFSQIGLIDHPKDIYYLHVDEVFQLVEGRSLIFSMIKEVINMRKQEFEKQQETESPERLYFFGDICNNNYVEIITDEDTSDDPDIDDSGTKFKGVPCCPGEIEGIAKIVLSPKDADLNGEILVTKRTDPGWVPLFPSVSGIVIERGSVLSHSAVVAREMGIPTIVGLRGITNKIQTGDRIRINGSTGIIEKL
ncbi:MAG: hypothetical protein HQK76_11315 [Desulfobacterales bacterium]|nr:hypothetical protein [Desulfobacterales bacterium]